MIRMLPLQLTAEAIYRRAAGLPSIGREDEIDLTIKSGPVQVRQLPKPELFICRCVVTNRFYSSQDPGVAI